VACFHFAYTSLKFPAAGLLIFGYALGLVQLANQPTVRRAFYFGLVMAYLSYAPQLFFMWSIFGPFAMVLWLVLAFWVGLFAAIVCGSARHWGKVKTAWLIPIIWTGIEYFRSELYYLKFSWLNIGYAMPMDFIALFGIYGVGFLVFTVATIHVFRKDFNALLKEKTGWRLVEVLIVAVILLILIALLIPAHAETKPSGRRGPFIVGVQMESPPENVIPQILNQALAKNTNAPIFVLSECMLDGPVPDSLKNWCREHSRFLVVGGKDFVTHHDYYNTAFVVGTNGEIVFKQAKSVPVQFFDDGLPAQKHEVWNSPWGKIGLCICYDLSYTRVTDRLVNEGAQLLIVPTMDNEDWGRHEHELHSRVAPVRAAEYGIPIFRVASSGISQAVTGGGQVIVQTRIPGSGDIFSALLRLPQHGSIPFDRYLAPLCAGITGIVTAVLLLLAWRDKRAKPKS
jgi:apolipoprotein N-acyltransferase